MRRRRLKRPPIVVSLSSACLTSEHALFQMFADADKKKTRHQLRELHALFAMEEDEREFARVILDQKPNYWVFRANQKKFCGDFIVVDMSCPDASNRKPIVVELKRGATLKLGGGGASNQLCNAAEAICAIATHTQAVPVDAVFEKAVGDEEEVLDFLEIDPGLFERKSTVEETI